MSGSDDVPDDAKMQNKEPVFDSRSSSFDKDKSVNGSQTSLKKADSEKDASSIKQFDDGEKELSKQGSNASLNNSKANENNSVKGSTSSLRNNDNQNQIDNGSVASLKHDDGEKEQGHLDEETENKSTNDSVLDSTLQETTVNDDVTQDTDSAIGETKNDDNDDVKDNQSIKSDGISSAVVLATGEPKGVEDETTSVKSNASEDDGFKLAETDDDQEPVTFELTKDGSSDKDDDDAKSFKSNENEEKSSIKSAGCRSISSKHGDDGAVAIAAGFSASLMIAADKKDTGDDMDNQSVSSEHKSISSTKEEVASNAGSINNSQPVALTAPDSEAKEQSAENEDIDNVSVETVTLADEQVTTAGEKKTGDGSESDEDDDKDQNDDDDLSLKDDEGHFEGDFVYDIYDSSSDESSDDGKKKDKLDDGTEYPLYATSFDSLHFHNDVKTSLYSVYGWTKPTDVQAKGLPQALKWKDCIIQGPPGCGKTMTYVLSCLNSLPRTTNRASAKSSTRVLVLCPSRELCIKVSHIFTSMAENMSNVSVATLAGGMSKREEQNELTRRPNIVIGTPGKIFKSLNVENKSKRKNHKKLNLSQLKTLVIEHSDLMEKNRQFIGVINNIFKKSPKKKQVILVSTTSPGLRNYARDPFEYLTENAELISPQLGQYYVNVVDDDEKNKTLCNILKEVTFKQALVFCNTTQNCSNAVNYLDENGIKAKPIHNDCPQENRKVDYDDFVHGKTPVLVTTDALSRVTANENVDLVVNYDMPAYDVTTFVHRVTKAVPVYDTSRGIAISFLETSNLELFQQAEKEYGFNAKELPGNLQDIQIPDAPESKGDKKPDVDVQQGIVIASQDSNAVENSDLQRPASGKEDVVDKDNKETDSIDQHESAAQENESSQSNKQETNSITRATSSQEAELRQSKTSLKGSRTNSRQQSAHSIKQEPQATRSMSATSRISAKSKASVKSQDNAKTCVCNIL